MDRVKETICDFDNLYKAMYKCKRGIMWKDKPARYVNNGIVSIHKSRKKFINNKHKINPYSIFTIHEPKTREIVSTQFEDRVFQTSLNDNYLYETMTNSFILDNHACQVGKGTDLARERLKLHMQRYFRKYGTDGFVLTCDFKNYFGSTRHDIAKETVRKSVDVEWVLMHTDMIIDSFNHGEDPETGMGLGSPITQITQLALPDELDHFIKEVLGIKHYIRYMDDFMLIHHDKEYLKYCLEEIRKFIKPLEISLNTKKTQIYKLKQGIKFLGFKFKLTETGKVLMILSKDNIKISKRKIRKHRDLLDKGEMTEKQIQQSFEGWKAHAEKGNNYHVVKDMEEFYRKIMMG